MKHRTADELFNDLFLPQIKGVSVETTENESVKPLMELVIENGKPVSRKFVDDGRPVIDNGPNHYDESRRTNNGMVENTLSGIVRQPTTRIRDDFDDNVNIWGES